MKTSLAELNENSRSLTSTLEILGTKKKALQEKLDESERDICLEFEVSSVEEAEQVYEETKQEQRKIQTVLEEEIPALNEEIQAFFSDTEE